jgi:naphthalene 1,2-dioxygenase system ferredoxin subunit
MLRGVVSQRHVICRTEKLAKKADGLLIAVYNVNGTYFSTENLCTHAYAELSDGGLEGNEIECPLHAGRFGVRTGQAIGRPVTCNLKTYPVRVNGERRSRFCCLDFGPSSDSEVFRHLELNLEWLFFLGQGRMGSCGLADILLASASSYSTLNIHYLPETRVSSIAPERCGRSHILFIGGSGRNARTESW